MNEQPVRAAKMEASKNIQPASQTRGHTFGDVTASGPAPIHLGDNFEVQNHYHYQQSLARHDGDSNEAKCKFLHESLLFPRMDARVNNVSKALYDTCTWLFQHNDFKAWHSDQHLTQHNGLLWIKGKPGCGKSTIMKTALDWVQKQNREESTDRKVVYYFFNARAGSSLEKSTLGLYRSLVYQVLALYPCLRPDFLTKFTHKNPERTDDEWTKNELQDFLSDMVHLNKSCSLYILIDALDEGEEQRDVRDMINFLVEFSESALDPDSSLDLRICLSSRHYPHISLNKGLSLTVEDQAEHNRDIEIYVHKKLVDSDTTAGSNNFFKQELAAEVCRRSASIFLWVFLVVRMLHQVRDRGGSQAEMRALLDTIPSELNELFEKILTRSTRGKEACIALLQCVLFAVRPLESCELYLAIQHSLPPVNTKSPPPSDTIIPSGDSLSLYILECSRGLVELTTTQPPLVQFIHETVRDHLLHSDVLTSLSPCLSDGLVGTSNEMLKTSCSRCIAQSAIPTELAYYMYAGYSPIYGPKRLKDALRPTLPFIEYSVTHIFQHAEQAQIHGISQEQFLRNQVSTNGMWQGLERQWRNIFQPYGIGKYINVTLLYFLAERGLLNILKELMQFSKHVNENCGRYGSTLAAACVTGNRDLVRFLLVNGANVHDTRVAHGHVLLSAIYSNNHSLIPILVEHGASLSHELLHKTMFEWIALDSTQGVASLLNLGADVNSLNSRQESTLQLAMNLDRPAMIDTLMEHANFDIKVILAQQRNEESLLVLAAKKRSTKVIRAILESGTPPAPNEQLNLALQVAVRNRQFDMAQLFVDHGAAMDALDRGECDRVLMLALENSENEMAQFLMHNGVVGTGTLPNDRCFMNACCDGDVKVVQQLIKNFEVDVNEQKGPYFESLLYAVCRIGQNDIARLLIENGASIDVPSGQNGTALQVACYKGYLDIVQLLIEFGADVNAQGGWYGTALLAAADRSSSDHSTKPIEIVRLLIQKGANVNFRAGFGHGTVLGYVLSCIAKDPSIKSRYAPVEQVLRDAGARLCWIDWLFIKLTKFSMRFTPSSPVV